MAVLNNWQKISRVLPGLPFGDGSAGAATIGSDPNVRVTATGTASSSSLTVGATTLADGDMIIIHQTQGTNANQWEVNRVASGGGTTNIVLAVALQYTYTTGAQAIKFALNTTVTVNSHNVAGWDGSTGGIGVYAGRNSVTISGAISINGGAGANGNASGTSAGGTGGGFRGGNGQANANSYQNFSGEGWASAQTQSRDRSDNAGGGAQTTSSAPRGGGGGNGTAGSDGESSQNFPGIGGEVAGAADGTTFTLGGGGGGAGKDNTNNGAGAGGAGAGAIIIFTELLTSTSAGVNANGGAGGAGTGGGTSSGGGGGAGGTIIVVCGTAALGTDTLVAAAGAGGSPGGGNGGVGRIAVHHRGTISGSTSNPSFTDVTDVSLFESLGGAGNYSFFM